MALDNNSVWNLLLATILLTLAGAASAATYQIEGDGNLLRIGNLELDFRNDDLDGLYNIDFVYSTGEEEYQVPPMFDAVGKEAYFLLPQINHAINAAPEEIFSVGPEGKRRYFVPGVQPKFLKFLPFDIYLAAGGERKYDEWRRCKSHCIAGITVLKTTRPYTYARISAVPIPAAAWFFGSALLGLAGVARRRSLMPMRPDSLSAQL